MSAVPLARTTPRATAPRLLIDPEAIAANTRVLAGQVARGTPGGTALMAVVKADGFGMGATTVARAALAHGATSLGVTTIAEGLALRAAGLDAPVLSWLNGVDADFAGAIGAGLDLAVPSTAHLAAIARATTPGRPARVHLHLDTGLARDGAEPSGWATLCRAARTAERAGQVHVVGLMGHLARADEPGHPANAAGRTRFAWGLQVARACGLRPALRHLAATAATLTDPQSHHTLVRVGAGLVGIDPSGTTALRPAVTLSAPVVQVRRVRAGTAVGYGHTWTTPRATTLALLPVGYADGLPRTASGRASVLLRGQRRAIVGRVSMDQVVLDLGDDAVELGDTATVLGPGDAGEPTPAEWAAWSGTLPHEVLTGFGPRLDRVVATTVLRSVR